MAYQFNFIDFVARAESLGFYDVVLPFLLVFTLVFAILQKTNILGTTNSKPFNAIVALVIGFLFIRSTFLVYWLKTFLPNISMFVIIIIAFLLLIGILGGGEFQGFTGPLMLGAGIVSLLLVGWALTTDYLYAPAWLYNIFYTWDIASLVVIGIFALILYFVLRTPPEEKQQRRFTTQQREWQDLMGFPRKPESGGLFKRK